MVEYLIVLSLILAIIFFMIPRFQQSIAQLWVFFAKNIVAPCPGCAPDPSIQF